MPKKNFWAVFICALWMSAGPLCWANGRAPESRRDLARQIGALSGFNEEDLQTDVFTLKSWTRFKPGKRLLRVYIEGDGFSWVEPSRPSQDPTPKNPVALKLAVLDSSPNVAYLARPCQYVLLEKKGSCDEKYWTDARYSAEVVKSVSQALDLLKSRSGCDRLELVGYSGGAALSLLVAAGRGDIEGIRTVAGGLDPNAVNAFHGMPPLKDSLDPTKEIARFSGIPQRHFTGNEDKTVPASIADDFVRHLGPGACADVVKVPGASHGKGWEEKWQGLLAEALPCQRDS